MVNKLDTLAFKKIGETISQAPPLIQEQIFDNAKPFYEDSLKKIIKEETRNDVMEELLEEYLLLIPAYIEEATELLMEYREIESHQDLELIMKNTTFNSVHQQIIKLVSETAYDNYTKLKNHFESRTFRNNSTNLW